MFSFNETSFPASYVNDSQIGSHPSLSLPRAPMQIQGFAALSLAATDYDDEDILMEEINRRTASDRDDIPVDPSVSSASHSETTGNTAPLPDGWRQARSKTRPGEFSYENVYTKERQAHRPTQAVYAAGGARNIDKPSAVVKTAKVLQNSPPSHDTPALKPRSHGSQTPSQYLQLISFCTLTHCRRSPFHGHPFR